MAISFDLFGFMRRKVRARRSGNKFWAQANFIPDFLSANNTSGFGLDTRGFTSGVPSSPSAESGGAAHRKPSPLVSALPLTSPPARITSISDIVFSNAAFDALLESRNAGDQ
ncbi:hypothetical protein EDD18DRAFT_1468228 [Armillaria luteobubalina]|uniref:Uncharacterized protein n=1 Tax=Armillaria luteobubalina TaxID=153913 RepID=A0AA39PBC1_9AGAR|nr:hypothetical protein EDD18DRAFT_1468228 [Armillaria luteobubalina]